MHDSEISFVPLLIVIALSFLVPVSLSPIQRLGIPVIVGEILAGILIGSSGLRLVEEVPVLTILSDFGFAYLMFLSGLEINFSAMPTRRGLRASGAWQRLVGNPFVIGGLMFALTMGLSLLAGLYLEYAGVVEHVWLIALILSTTSLGVVAPVLKERGFIATRYGQTILASAVIADFVTILLISAYVLFRGQGLTFDLLLILVLLIAFLVVYRIAARFRENPPAQRLMRALSSATSQIEVRGSLALALVFIALAEGLGIENILGAFLAGVIISLLSGSQGSILREKLDAIGYGFFIPIFFIMVGVNLDLPALLASDFGWRLVALLVAIAFTIKLASGMVFRLAYDWRDTFAASVLLSARLSLIIAAATIGREIGLISPALEAAIILVAIVTCLLAPVTFLWAVPAGSLSQRERVIIVGNGRDIETLTRRLQNLEQDAVALGDLPSAAEGEHGASQRREIARRLREAGIDEARTVVAMQDSDDANLQVCRIARNAQAVPHIVAWVRDPSLTKRFAELGARVTSPANSKMLVLEGMVLSAEAFGPVPEAEPGQDVRVVKLHNRWLQGMPLSALGLPDGVNVLRIDRRGEVVEPTLESLARANDVFTLSGDPEKVDEVARRFAKRW